MGLWEYCFKDFTYPYYQFPRLFNGCHNIFSHVSCKLQCLFLRSYLFVIFQEYYVIREYLLPGWLMAVQTFVTLAFIDTFAALAIMACEVCRYPLKFVLRYEWLLTTVSFVAVTASSVFLFFGVVIFGFNAYRRDWLMYPKFNIISWSFGFAVIAMVLLGLAGLVLYKDAKIAYERRRESKNLVQQMQMHETASIPSSHSRGIHGYI